MSPRHPALLLLVCACTVEPAPVALEIAESQLVPAKPDEPVDASPPAPAPEPESTWQQPTEAGFAAARLLHHRIEDCGRSFGPRRFQIVVEEARNSWLTIDMAVDTKLARCITRVMDRLTPPKPWVMHARLAPDARGRGGREWSQSREQVMHDID